MNKKVKSIILLNNCYHNAATSITEQCLISNVDGCDKESLWRHVHVTIFVTSCRSHPGLSGCIVHMCTTRYAFNYYFTVQQKLMPCRDLVKAFQYCAHVAWQYIICFNDFVQENSPIHTSFANTNHIFLFFQWIIENAI